MLKITEEAALTYHEEKRLNRVEVKPTKPYKAQANLSLAYSPSVAYPCLETQDNKNNAYKYTNKGGLVTVISSGTAMLDLGDIGAVSGRPVMGGKGLLFEIYGNVDVFGIKINKKGPIKFCETVERIAPSSGDISLKDIKASEYSYIKERLKKNLDIPVMHGGQHGTAIISAAGLKNTLEVTGKGIKKTKLIINGAGAATISCTKLCVALGVKEENILMLNSRGAITTNRAGLNPRKAIFVTNHEDVHTLEEALKDADVFVGLPRGNILSRGMIRSMASNPIVSTLANPVPEVGYEDAPDSWSGVIMSIGCSDYPNQINDIIGFLHTFRDILDVHTETINEEMKMAAIHAITDLAKQPIPDVVSEVYYINDLSFSPKYFYLLHISPSPRDS